jgi:SAM-dependent methyltransferase
MNINEMKTRKDYSDLYRQMVAFQNWHWWFRVHYDWIKNLLRTYLLPSSHILDMGCGPGVCASRLDGSAKAVLMDIRPLALSYCAFNPHGRICGDAKSAPLKDKTFDIVICSDLLHQCDVEDPRRVVREAFRLCRPGGVILLVEPAFPCLFGPHDEVENGCRRYTTAGLFQLFHDLPVRLIKKTYFHMFMFLPAFLVRRVFSRFSSRKKTDLDLGNSLTNFLGFCLETIELCINRFIPLPLGTSAAVLVQREED